MKAGKLSKGELQDAAGRQGLDPDQSYETLREAVDFHVCKWCGGEFLDDMWNGFCTDGCQVEYINEYHR